MAKDLICALNRFHHGWMLLLLCVPMAPSLAQELIDPTQPPAGFGLRSDADTSDDSGLQSIIISPLRRAAIINGQTVELGEKIGDVTLIEVNENGIVLQGARERQVLSLFPNVRIHKKAILPSMKNEVNHSAQMGVATEQSHSGGKEEKK